MGKQKKARKYATMKRMLSLRDQRLKEKDRLKPKKKEKKDPSALKEREVPQHPSCLFFQYNTQLGPPYHILVDTNFINFSIKAKLDLVQSMMDCLYAKCIPCITDCVMAEIEKLGQKYRVALRIAKDPRFERLPCTHKGTYADDCLVQRVTQVSSLFKCSLCFTGSIGALIYLRKWIVNIYCNCKGKITGLERRHGFQISTPAFIGYVIWGTY
uniref:FCF1 rRNA-processing protein n=1 Tax=Ailuropoda melanoleuca TaxID=9646 RepID=A0A7N5JMN6_AILME